MGRNLNYESQKCGLSPFYRKEELLSLTIGSKVTIIGSRAFSGCSAITNVTIPNSVTEILDGAFYYCTALKELYIEDGYTTLELGNLTFDSSLETLYLGRNLNYNYSYANSKYPPFYNQTELKSLIIGNCVSTIGNSLFCGCSAITSVIIPNSVKIIRERAFFRSKLKEVVMSDNVEEIGYGCFSYSILLEKVTLSKNLRNLQNELFAECEKLTTVLNIPERLEKMGLACFMNTAITSLAISEGVTLLSGRLVERSVNLTSLTICSTITRIQDQPISGCLNLKDIYFNGTIEQWNQIEKEDNWDENSGDYVIHCINGDISKGE